MPEFLPSTAFREKGLEQARFLPGEPTLFVNTHPLELRDADALLRSLESLRGRHPFAELVLEIHEAAVTDVPSLRTLRKRSFMLPPLGRVRTSYHGG